jgi:succinate dehydrogenase / fumarate reductase cytochrome b subunit
LHRGIDWATDFVIFLPLLEAFSHMSKVERRRPLSPHLQVYRPMLTMMMSIFHRITGAALYAGALLLVYYLIAAANGPASFATATSIYGSIIGQIVLFGFTWALFHHLLGGIRHAIWDTGYGMDHPVREYLAQGTAIGGIALTIIVWALAFMMR